MRTIEVFFVALCALTVAQGGRIGCYYASWAIYRSGNGQFQPENMDVQHCTHIVYAFAGLDSATNEIMSLDTWNDLESGLNGYNRFTSLVSKNPNLVPMLSVGGWNEGSSKYSTMVASETSRNAFINSVLVFFDNYGFKGLDLDWEYPTQRGGLSQDKDNLVLLLQGLRSAFTGRGYVLSIAAAVNNGVADSAYDVPSIMEYVDFVNLLSYDYHSYTDNYTGHGEPLNARPDEEVTFSLNSSIHYWLSAGATADKLNFGLAAYGHTYALSNQTSNGPHATSSGPGLAGPYTASAGTLGYNEICLNKWPAQTDSSWQAPYAYSGNQWVSYDDAASVQAKCSLSKSLAIGGAWVYSLDTDDFRNSCGGGAFPLVTSIYNNC